MNKNAEVSSRWLNAEGLQLRNEILQRLAANKPLHDLKLGESNNRIDLRGICVPEVSEQELPPFRDWRLRVCLAN